MDIIRFPYTPGMVDPFVLDRGTIVPNIKTVMWIERYRDNGEFTITGALDSGLRELLIPGTPITHINTREVMIVENVGFTESLDGFSDIAITGRSLETILEQRSIGQNYTWPKAIPSLPADMLPRKYTLTGYSFFSAVQMMRDHITGGFVVNAADAIAGIFPICNMSADGSFPALSTAREIDRGLVYERLIELLGEEDLGIKSVRPRDGTITYTALEVHRGVDRSSTVNFDYRAGEIRDGDYLWSNKNTKNAALVLGKWLEVFIPGTSTGYDRRVMIIDASDIDGGYTAYPTVPAEHASLVAQMTTRGNTLLQSQKELNITRVEVTENANTAAYRTDYDVGDRVTVSGNYSTSTTMRVVEYVEIQDETGERGYPTLSGL